MGWTESQRRMLEVFGVQLPPQAVAPDAGPAPAPAAEAPSTEAVAAAPAARKPAAQGPMPAAEAVRAVRPVAPVVDGERAAAIARMDWPALRQAVADCTACGLCSGRTQTVFGVGHERAHWMIVGEAPGEQEDLRGEPFVGPSGQLLDAMLASVGLSRGEGPPERQVFIANTLKCRPPGNRNPSPDELAQCEAFLVRQVALVQPRIILAMGRFAVQSLLRSSEPIGRLRGRVHRYQGVPLVVTYHPAYLLRNLDDKARAWDDLCLALATAGASGLPSGGP
jgi:uracil-DNA glycosylase family 4